MSHRFVRCPHCKMPHDAAERVCPTTGRRIEPSSAQTDGRRSRMSEMPPPERRPEPLGFDPAKNRIAEQAARAASLQQPSTATLNPTRNLQADLIGRTVSDRYVVKGVLGEGGMGTVYEAEHMGLGRAVAIKVLNPAQAKKRVAVKRFQQEARAAGAIGHPNICEVYDLGLLDDGSPYLVMEKLIGTTLADRISREGGLPFDEIADVMIQVLSGLIAAHDKGIVHRDIKPENIFLARRVGCPPIAKILDFGVSKMMPQFQGGDEQLDLTRTGMVMGTPYYMSPEQARGERNLDGRVDVYACGVMMYEAIVGKRPFLAPNYNALLLSIINTTPKAIREVRPATPPAMESVVTRMMAKARDDRYASANAVLRDIQALPVAVGALAGRMPAPPTAAERLRAPVLGGRPDPRERERERERDEAASRGTRVGRRPSDAGEGAGATLRSRMAEAQPQSPAHAQAQAQAHAQAQGRENATRLDIKMSDVRDARAGGGGRRADRHDESDSIDIPIHITGSDLIPVQTGASGAPGNAGGSGGAGADFVDEMPTEIFRPGMHPFLGAPASRAPAPMAPAPMMPIAPASFGGLGGDDWDGETVVKRPAALTTSRHRDRPSSSREPARQPAHPPAPDPARAPVRPLPKPFNPDETVNLQGDIDVDVDFGDDTHNMSGAPRRPR